MMRDSPRPATDEDRARWVADLERMAAALRLDVAILPALAANLRALADEIGERHD